MKKTDEKEAINMLISLNQRLILNNKEHIKNIIELEISIIEY